MPQVKPKTDSEALLAELNVNSEQIDPLPPRNDGDPLQVGPKTPPTPRQKMEKFSTRAGGKGFNVKVTGEYYRASKEDPKKKIKKTYETTFVLPNLDAPLSIIRNKLINQRLKKLDPIAGRFRTINIVSATPLSPSTPESRNLAYMSREKLLEYAAEVQVPIDVEDLVFEDTVFLRETIIDFAQNAGTEVGLKKFKDKMQKRIQDRAEADELMKMNPDLQAAPDVNDAPTMEPYPERPD